jgi:hypothetical protein
LRTALATATAFGVSECTQIDSQRTAMSLPPRPSHLAFGDGAQAARRGIFGILRVMLRVMISVPSSR